MNIIFTKLKWYHNESVWITGFVRDRDKYIIEAELINYFSKAETEREFEQILLNANGQFSVIIKKHGALWAATDRLRNFPLFYTWVSGEFYISDDCYKLADILQDKKINHLAENCFLAGGFTLNNLTLINGIFQIEAGELIVARENFMRRFYHNPAINPIKKLDIEIAVIEMQNLFREVFQNHFTALRDNFIAIPLSGGFDSRLVALMCSKYHPNNVLCYTYGREENCEVAPAREVATRLGLKWINIKYDTNLINGYRDDKYFDAFHEYSSGLSSMFYMQDYFATRYLKEKELIPENTVFVPGFSGDSLAGSFLTPSLKNHDKKSQITSRIFNDKFCLMNLDEKKRENICHLIEEKINIDIDYCWKNYEEWEIKEIHAKFIINSAKVFSFFGYQYVMPFFDNQMVDFFTSLPFEFKQHKKLYDHVLITEIFRQSNVNLKQEINPKPFQRKFQQLKEKAKRYIPDRVINSLIELKSPILYDEITRNMIEEMGNNIIKPRQANYYNSYLAQWYLFKTKEKYGIT